MHNRFVGQKGEDRAAAFLAGKGYHILARNVRTRYGELDIVALHEDTIVFVEVKTRISDVCGGGVEALHPAKQRQLVRLAQAYIARHGWEERAARFDVVAIGYNEWGKEDIELIENAFDAE